MAVDGSGVKSASLSPAEEAQGDRVLEWPVNGLPRDVSELLTQPLDRKLVRRRKSGGRLIAYVEGHQVVNQANRIFGHANWGAEVVGPITYRPMASARPEHGEPAAVGMYSATVRVQVRGCMPKSDAGSGFALDDSPDAHDTALKTAVTDAMKRTLRHFGEPFGNGLYEKANPVRLSGAREVADLRSAVLTLGAQLDLDATETRRHVAQKVGHPFAQLSAADLAGVVRAMADALAKRQHAA